VTELRPKEATPFHFQEALQHQYPELSFVRPEGEVVYRVEGVTGPLLLTKAVEHFASKSALDIDTLCEKNVVALVTAGLVKDLADLYTMTKAQLLTIDRFADISAGKLVDAIANKRTPLLERFVYGLGIRHVGIQTAIDLVNAFGSLDALQHASIDQLKVVNGVGETVAESIAAWFADPDNESLIAKFGELHVVPVYEKMTGTLSGQNFVVTGSLASLSRDEAADAVRRAGGTFQSAVGKDTTYLVAGGKVGESKLKKATSYGTKVIDEQDFLKLLET
jgi:DNA ligase (NAD+)